MRRWYVVLLAGALIVVLMVACQSEDLGFSVVDLPTGDAARGAALFAQKLDGAPACASCHALDGSRSSGPSLHGYGTVAGTRVGGQSAAEYTFYSILRPAKHIMRGYSNIMVSDYAEKLSQQDIADLIAYLLSL